MDYKTFPIRMRSVRAGALIGGAIGIAEVVVQLALQRSSVTRSLLLEAFLVYALGGALFVFILFGLARVLRREPPSLRACGASIFAIFSFLVVGGMINVYLLPEVTRWSSLVSIAVLAVFSIGMAIVIYKIAGNAWANKVERWLNTLMGQAFKWGALVAGGIFIVFFSFMPAREGKTSVRSMVESPELNVVLIVIDALRADHMSLYGYLRETTPRIDDWATEGFVFEGAMANSSWTKTSMASILSSLYPTSHAVTLVHSALSDEVETLPKILWRHGYHTAIFTANMFITPAFGFDQGVDFFYSTRTPHFQKLMVGHILIRLGHLNKAIKTLAQFPIQIERWLLGEETPAGGVEAPGLTQAFGKWLNRVEDDRFFAYLHYMEPHDPYGPLPLKTPGFTPLNRSNGPLVLNRPLFHGFFPFEKAKTVSPGTLEGMIDLYDGEIRWTDYWIGELIQELKRRDLFEKTLIILTSDHGEEFYDHYAWGHGRSLFQEVIHVPLVLSCPEALREDGRRFSHRVRHIDIMPTILDFCGLAPPEGIAGESLVPILRGDEPPLPSRPVFSEVFHVGFSAHSLIEGTRKVTSCEQMGASEVLAFDLATDPHETDSLDPMEAPWRTDLLSRLENHKDLVSRQAATSTDMVIDEAMREQLKALGYIQ